MRTLKVASGALLLGAVAMIALLCCATSADARPPLGWVQPKASTPPQEHLSINGHQVGLRFERSNCNGGAAFQKGTILIIALVPENTPFGNEMFAKAVLNAGRDYVRKSCPGVDRSTVGTIKVALKENHTRPRYEKDLHVSGEYKATDNYMTLSVYDNERQNAEIKAQKKEAERRAATAKEAERQLVLAKAAEGMITLPKSNYLFLFDTDKETGTKFYGYSKAREERCWKWAGGFHDMIVEVPSSVSLMDDAVARRIVNKAIQIGWDTCKAFQATITVVPSGYKATVDGEYVSYVPIQVKAGGSNGKLTSYHNLLQEAVAQKAAANAAAAEAARKAQATEQRWKAFVSQNGISKLVSHDELFSNPFVFEKQTIAVVVGFERMIAADRGVFEMGGDPIVVSELPKTRFGRSTRTVMVAARVLGTTPLNVPLVGETAVPHLAYTAAEDCQDETCSEMMPAK